MVCTLAFFQRVFFFTLRNSFKLILVSVGLTKTHKQQVLPELRMVPLNLAFRLVPVVWPVGVVIVMEKCGLWGKAGPTPWSFVYWWSLSTIPPTSNDLSGQSSCTGTPISSTDPVITPESGRCLRKNCIVGLIISSTNLRFTSTVLFNVRMTEDKRRHSSFYNSNNTIPCHWAVSMMSLMGQQYANSHNRNDAKPEVNHL